MKQKRNPLTGRWNLTPDVKSGQTFKIAIVDYLPEFGEENIIYIVKGRIYSDMYVRDPAHGEFVKVGTTKLEPQVQADWLEQDDTKPSYIQNKPELAEVAYTGSYDSLTNTPEIPEVYDSQININVNGTPQSFTLNQDDDKDINITVPTKTSDLENDVPFARLDQVPTKTSDLDNDVPFATVSQIPTKTSDLENDVPFATVSQVPTKVSDLDNDLGFINKFVNNLEYYTKTEDLAPVAFSNDYDDLDNKPTIPTNLSQFVNDTGFIDNTVNNLVNYYKKTETYTQAEVDALIAGISSLRVEVVTQLPNPGQFGVIYLIESSTPGIYNQFILTALPNTYVQVGSTEIDLSAYFNKNVDTADNINDGVNKVVMTTAERVNLSHQSGTNTGDETNASIKFKLGPASALDDGYLLKEDWQDFDEKVDYDDFVRVPVSGNTIAINNYSTEASTSGNVIINCGSSVKSGLIYLLKITAVGDTTLVLGQGVSNTSNTNLHIPEGEEKVFTFLATSATTLDTQGIDTSYFVRRDELATVATTGSYNDLSDKPQYAQVATTGNYNDLNHKPNFADVAFSGDYNDLVNVPSIGAIGNGRLRIRYDGEVLGDFRANQSDNETIDIPVGGFTGNQIYSEIAKIGTESGGAGGDRDFYHGFDKRPAFVSVDGYLSLGPDSNGLNRVTRFTQTWNNGYAEWIGTIIHLSDGTRAGYPEDLSYRPVTITVDSEKINVSCSRFVKVRVLAYL